MGLSTFDKATTRVKAVSEAIVDAGRRSVVKGGLALSIMALWQFEPLEALEKNLAENKKSALLPLC